jgi:hypothetical protein
MGDLVETFLDWLPLIALGAYVVFFMRPVNVASFFIRRALKKDKEEKAMAIAIRYTRIRPHDPRGWLMWVWLVERQEVRWGSEGILRRGFELNPESLHLGLDLAKELSSKDKAGEAYELLEGIRERHPRAPGPIIEMARLASMADNKTETRSLIADARELMDPKKHSSEAVDIAYLLLLLREHGAAEEVLRSVEEDSYEPAPHLFLALLTEQTNLAEARRHLATARYYWQGPRTDLAESFEESREFVQSR